MCRVYRLYRLALHLFGFIELAPGMVSSGQSKPWGCPWTNTISDKPMSQGEGRVSHEMHKGLRHQKKTFPTSWKVAEGCPKKTEWILHRSWSHHAIPAESRWLIFWSVTGLGHGKTRCPKAPNCGHGEVCAEKLGISVWACWCGSTVPERDHEGLKQAQGPQG